MTGQPDDVVPSLAGLLGVEDCALVGAIGPFTHAASEWDGELHVFTGRANPRAPERPVVALRVMVTEAEVEVGRAVGVPLPDGSMRWTLAEPRTRVAAIADHALLLDALREAVVRVLDADMLRGVEWGGP